jgi:hypothetical protein
MSPQTSLCVLIRLWQCHLKLLRVRRPSFSILVTFLPQNFLIMLQRMQACLGRAGQHIQTWASEVLWFWQMHVFVWRWASRSVAKWCPWSWYGLLEQDCRRLSLACHRICSHYTLIMDRIWSQMKCHNTGLRSSTFEITMPTSVCEVTI